MKSKILFFLSFLFICCSTEETEVQLDAVVDGKYKTNVLIEDYTGAWCGYCPRMSKGIEDLWSSTNKRISPVAIHNESPGRSDPFAFAKEGEMRAKIYGNSFPGWPNSVLNRNVQTQRGSINKSVITDLIAVDSNVGLALESSLKERTLSLTVKVGFGADLSNLKLVVYLTENGLKANQRTFGDLGYGEGTNGYLVDFVHDNTLRASISQLFGDPIDTSKSKNGEIYEKSYSYVIPEAYSLQSNIVVFVVNKDDIALNSRFFVTTGEAASNGKFQTVE
tara:strand:+ start:49 stop:882 length:834 start_codon:yes stop_codon:yes gene_type:complete